MTTKQTIPILSPEEIAVRAGQQVPYQHLPDRLDLFFDRETRLRQRAAGHPMRDFLLFAAELTHVQHDILQRYPEVALPDMDALQAAARVARPPLPAEHWPRDPQWRTQFRRLVEQLLPRLDGNPAQASVRKLQDIGDEALEKQADLLLHQVMFGLDMAAAPVIAAALQVYWTHMVLTVQQRYGNGAFSPFGRTTVATLCPCCGSRPTASITRIDATSGQYRYLHCSLCATQWHMVRIKCSHCESTKGIHYQALQAADDESTEPLRAAVEAETCDECRHYLKIVRMERNHEVEPVADDLASITLDLLISEAGYQRYGVNLLLLFGEHESPPSHTPPDSGGH
ncbi:formate dehydrogenase accessory protein FdhE [Uliginosibacterium sp. sgz301328]|uniref:formate dehydrogenase accessory protein FdhE n=1 Tax=Uliginosibacterium sp. sgz301328 TaxID=3243764 RepID=UPI00359DCE4B